MTVNRSDDNMGSVMPAAFALTCTVRSSPGRRPVLHPGPVPLPGKRIPDRRGEQRFLADTALTADGVHGSRLTGGGSGVCTIGLVDSGAVDVSCEQLSSPCQQRFVPVRALCRCVGSARTPLIGR